MRAPRRSQPTGVIAQVVASAFAQMSSALVENLETFVSRIPLETTKEVPKARVAKDTNATSSPLGASAELIEEVLAAVHHVAVAVRSRGARIGARGRTAIGSAPGARTKERISQTRRARDDGESRQQNDGIVDHHSKGITRRGFDPIDQMMDLKRIIVVLSLRDDADEDRGCNDEDCEFESADSGRWRSECNDGIGLWKRLSFRNEKEENREDQNQRDEALTHFLMIIAFRGTQQSRHSFQFTTMVLKFN